MKKVLIFFLTCISLFSSGQSTCNLQIGGLQFDQPKDAAEAFVGEKGDTIRRIRYIIPEASKQALLEAIFGTMQFNCEGSTTMIKSYSLKVEGDNLESPYEKQYKTNYILRDDTLQSVFAGKRFKIFLDNIQLFTTGTQVQSIAILFGE